MKSKANRDDKRPQDCVRLSVNGQLIDVSWNDLLDPGKWFADGAHNEEAPQPDSTLPPD